MCLCVNHKSYVKYNLKPDYLIIFLFFLRYFIVTFNFLGRKTGVVSFFCVRHVTLLTSDWSSFSLRSLTQNITCRLAVECKLLWQ